MSVYSTLYCDVINADHASRGCPRCLSQAPANFSTTFCRSETAFWAEARAATLRLVADVSLTPSAVNSTVDIYLEPHCQCALLQGKSIHFTLSTIIKTFFFI